MSEHIHKVTEDSEARADPYFFNHCIFKMYLLGAVFSVPGTGCRPSRLVFASDENAHELSMRTLTTRTTWPPGNICRVARAAGRPEAGDVQIQAVLMGPQTFMAMAFKLVKL